MLDITAIMLFIKLNVGIIINNYSNSKIRYAINHLKLKTMKTILFLFIALMLAFIL